MIDWHRLFGMVLTDFFTGSPFDVEVEKDLSQQQQKLDVIIIRKRPGDFSEPLPDGFDELAPHNLLTFKSYQEALTSWSLQELVGYYVSYRKLVSPSTDVLLTEDQFRLFAFCARFPQQLASQVALQPVRPGVYDYGCMGLALRIVVAHQLPEAERNALCHLFSALPSQVAYAMQHYKQHSSRTSSLVKQLLTRYHDEGLTMTYTMEDFERDVKKEVLAKMTPEERLQGLSPEEILKAVPPEERLRGLPPEEILKAVPPEVIERYLQKRKSEQAPKSEKNGAEANEA